MNTQTNNLVIIGGGAAGLMAAAIASSRGIKTIMMEPNKLTGKKLRITGKGRCNVTNACDSKAFLTHVPRNPKFLYGAIYKFDSASVMEYFESLGVPLKVERGQRVFPVSDSAHDIAKALEHEGHKNGVRWVQETALSIETQDGAVTAVVSNKRKIPCSNVILATGGVSYPLTGSTGDGYEIAKKLGHTIVEPEPSLVPLESNNYYCAEMQGFSLKNVSLSVFDENNKCMYKDLGEMIFTHFGISGPLVLSASAHLSDYKNHKYKAYIDLKPALDEKKLDERLLRDFEKYQNKEFKNALGDLASKTMIPFLIKLSQIPENTKVNSITREQRAALLHLLKNFPVDISGPRPINEAIITSGGVNVREIDPKTMESKLVSGLYFAGEVIDVDAYTGGFNLQIAWSTAHCAANAIYVEEEY